MWWEFKVIFSAAVAAALVQVWESWGGDDDGVSRAKRGTIGKKINFAIVGVVVFVILWFIWGPTRYEPLDVKQGELPTFRKLEK